ncbi:hypothetical protein ACFX13_046716 [Malus domestica]
MKLSSRLWRPTRTAFSSKMSAIPSRDLCSVTQASTVGSVESVKASTDIKSPVSGNIIEVNKELLSSPGLVNGSPYEKGWITKVEMSTLSV